MKIESMRVLGCGHRGLMKYLVRINEELRETNQS
jgi:hypothetical protein